MSGKSIDDSGNSGTAGFADLIDPLLNLRFHEIHGKNIELREGERVAMRNQKSFCDAIVFTQRPVRLYEKVYFRIALLSSFWNGMVRFGFTSVDSETLWKKRGGISWIS